MRKTKKGFTLVELLVVIAILAVLTTVAIVGYSTFVNKAKEAKAQAEVQQMATYISAEFADDNKWEDLDRSTLTPEKLTEAIGKCDELDSFKGDVSVTIENGVITIKYTLDGKSASATVK